MDRDLFKRVETRVSNGGKGEGEKRRSALSFLSSKRGGGEGKKKERKLKLVEYENWRKLSL